MSTEEGEPTRQPPADETRELTADEGSAGEGATPREESIMALTEAPTTDTDGLKDLTAPSPLSPGTRVEVRSTLDRRWSAGFEVIEETETGYRLRRLSDGSALPGAFVRADLRRERRRSGQWWF